MRGDESRRVELLAAFAETQVRERPRQRRGALRTRIGAQQGREIEAGELRPHAIELRDSAQLTHAQIECPRAHVIERAEDLRDTVEPPNRLIAPVRGSAAPLDPNRAAIPHFPSLSRAHRNLLVLGLPFAVKRVIVRSAATTNIVSRPPSSGFPRAGDLGVTTMLMPGEKSLTREARAG